MEETVDKKYNLALVTIYNPNLHGKLCDNLKHLYNQFIVIDTIDIEDFYDDDEYSDILTWISGYKGMSNLTMNIKTGFNHPLIKNYENIFKSNKSFQLEIVEKKYFVENKNNFQNNEPDDESNYWSFATIKTSYIRIIQNAWKNYLRKKKVYYGNIFNLRNREVNPINWKNNKPHFKLNLLC